MVVFPSASLGRHTANPEAGTAVEGIVAAQIYMETGKVRLSGGANTHNDLGGSELISVPSRNDFVLQFTDTSVDEKVKVSLNPNSQNFIRKVLNTNPTITNSDITSAGTRNFYQGGTYFLGETFEYSLEATGSDSIGLLGNAESAASATGPFHAAIMPMAVNGAKATQQNDFHAAATKATTGFFISQDLSTDTASYAARNQQQLFRLEALSAGEWVQREIKVSISNIKAAKGNFQSYGTFSVLIRDIADSDNRPIILERFDNLNLNPASENYIAKVIGDRYQVYDTTDKRNVEYGQFKNRSNYVRVVMNDDIAAGAAEPRLLPFGVFGPVKYRDVGIISGSGGFTVRGETHASAAVGSVRTMLDGGPAAEYGNAGYSVNEAYNGILTLNRVAPHLVASDYVNAGFTGSIRFPSVPLRTKSTWGSPKSTKNTFWGAWTGRSATDVFYNPQIPDCLRVRTFDISGINTNPASTALDVEGETTTNKGTDPHVTSWVFSLDNVSGSVTAGYEYNSSYRVDGTSLSAISGSFTGTLDAGIDRFTTTLHGGFDGLDITEREPFRNSKMNAIDSISETNSYELFTLRKAINIVSDPDDVQMNAITIPGVTVAAVTNYLLDTAEDRGDAIALIDIANAYTPDTETTGNEQSRNSGNTPTAAANALADRSINNSYGATYYPWVRILDTNTNQTLWVPPSVAALGVLSNTDRKQAPWFAPAGFTRGGLSEGAAGVPVLDVSRRLTSDDRDKLYENNINPIAKFPAEGIVIFGQKTLQQTASALDRINVRRLMIFLKREISFIASRLLFAPNAQATWDRFLGQAEPVLRDVKAQFGIDDFRLILDESTTTPDLIDRNIIYAKLYVKPTRAVEFFAIDFIITNSGASFED